MHNYDSAAMGKTFTDMVEAFNRLPKSGLDMAHKFWSDAYWYANGVVDASGREGFRDGTQCDFANLCGVHFTNYYLTDTWRQSIQDLWQEYVSGNRSFGSPSS